MTEFYKTCKLDDGTYEGLQSGYSVTILRDGKKDVIYTSKNGVRGINIPVRVTVKDGNATEEYAKL